MSDSFEEFKKIEWKWNQRWYEFGYHTLKNKVKEFQQEIDDIDGEISRLNVLLESKKREQQCLSDEITQMTSNPRESEEWILIRFADQAEAELQQKLDASKQIIQVVTAVGNMQGYCGCGWSNQIVISNGSHRKNKVHQRKVKEICWRSFMISLAVEIGLKILPFGEEWIRDCIIPFLVPPIDWERWQYYVDEAYQILKSQRRYMELHANPNPINE